MAYTNILSRKLGIEFINLGFSGSGKGEPQMAKLITQIENPLCYILDYEPNCIGLKYYKKTLPEFIKILRSSHKDIPIPLFPIYLLLLKILILGLKNHRWKGKILKQD